MPGRLTRSAQFGGNIRPRFRVVRSVPAGLKRTFGCCIGHVVGFGCGGLLLAFADGALGGVAARAQLEVIDNSEASG